MQLGILTEKVIAVGAQVVTIQAQTRRNGGGKVPRWVISTVVALVGLNLATLGVVAAMLAI